MLKRILVPLDGSKRAEQAIPVATRLARASGAAIVLLQAVPVPTEYHSFIQETAMTIPYALSLAVPPAVEQDARYTALADAQSYLDITAKSGELADIEVETQALFGTAAVEILAAAQSLHADMIVLCSHGYTSFKRTMPRNCRSWLRPLAVRNMMVNPQGQCDASVRKAARWTTIV